MLDTLIPISPQDNIENKQAEISEKPYMLKKNWHELSISSCSKKSLQRGCSGFKQLTFCFCLGVCGGECSALMRKTVGGAFGTNSDAPPTDKVI